MKKLINIELTIISSKAANSSPPSWPKREILYHCRTGVRASDGSSLTIGRALVRPKNSGLPWLHKNTVLTKIIKSKHDGTYENVNVIKKH